MELTGILAEFQYRAEVYYRQTFKVVRLLRSFLRIVCLLTKKNWPKTGIY